jgi:WD40 repeat protein/uncharacterized caspase-like protein
MAALILAFGMGPAKPLEDSAGQDRDLIRVREEPPEQPWLRINVGGHTAAVRGLAFTPDSTRLCSAGLDQAVQVWNLRAVFRDLRRVFLRERTIRWPVARGLRGSIYALAAAPDDGLLAFGGYGAIERLGDVFLVDPVAGTLLKVLEGHQQTVCSLAFSGDGKWLASMDVAGQAMLWKRDAWEPITLRQPDRKTYGPKNAALIQQQPKFRPIAFAGSSHVVFPLFEAAGDNGLLEWKLGLASVTDPERPRTLDSVHRGMVTALAASRDGSRLASGDLEGNLYLWDLTRGGRPDPLKAGAPVVSLSFSPDSETLVVGTAIGVQSERSQLQIWNVRGRKIERRRTLPDHVYACSVSPDGQKVAYSGGEDNEVFLEPLRDGGDAVRLRGNAKRILKVAFAKQEPFYRIAFGTGVHQRGFNDYANLEATFDPERLELESGDPPNPADWLRADWLRGEWRAELVGPRTLQLYRGKVAKGSITLDPTMGGMPRCYCWIPDRQGKPFAIAAGTDQQNSIYVYRLVEKGPCPILRHFRGHHDYVTSVGVSRDLRYLASGSADGTIRFWSLAGLGQGRAPLGRWGADFAVQGEQLVVTEIHEAGPLFRRGLRPGDVLEGIRWHDGQREQSEQQAAAMLKRLQDLSWTKTVFFETARNGAARPAFQRVPAWEPLATLFVCSDREWAFWTPEGYYDASVNGHTLFGWQVNRGLDALPDFYRADQFRRRLERPDVMRRLLPVGSLEGALQQAAVRPPAETHEILPKQIAATPRVEILSPRPGTLIQQTSTRVTARIKMPSAGHLLRAKVFANGVVAPKRQLIDQRQLEDGSELTYAWDVALPTDEQNLIQLVVATDAPTAAFSNVLVERDQPESPQPERPAKLYLLAVGINQYRDAEVPRLSYSVADAEAVAAALKSRSRGLYALDEAAILTNRDVTPETWRESLQQLSEKLKEVARPDDLLVLFLAGHGIVDDQTQQYYFLGHDFRLADLDQGEYTKCISWDDFRALADVPCRKLALLDTCHSGAVQPLRSYHLKTAVRALQEDVIFTVTASAGHEKAAEKKDWGHGVFTKCLLEALEGRADDSRDGVVTLDEVVTYVTESVASLTERRQNPTAGPEEILRYTTLPLTRVAEQRSEIPAEAKRVTHSKSRRPGGTS